MATITLNSENFKETVATNEIVLVDFWASWCGPCRMFAPTFEKSSEQHLDIVFGKVDTGHERELAAAFGIMSIPTLMAFREQVIVFAQPGALPAADLEALIGQVEGLDMAEVHREVTGIEVDRAPSAG